MSFSPQQRSRCVEWFIEKGKSVSSFQQRYRREQRANQADHRVTAPDAKSIKKWCAKFKEGDLKNKKRIRSKYVRTPQKTAEVVQLFEVLPHSSQRWTEK